MPAPDWTERRNVRGLDRDGLNRAQRDMADAMRERGATFGRMTLVPDADGPTELICEGWTAERSGAAFDMMPDHLQTLREREAWLRARIAAKQSIGWDVQWDERERAALAWALVRLEAAAAT